MAAQIAFKESIRTRSPEQTSTCRLADLPDLRPWLFAAPGVAVGYCCAVELPGRGATVYARLPEWVCPCVAPFYAMCSVGHRMRRSCNQQARMRTAPEIVSRRARLQLIKTRAKSQAFNPARPCARDHALPLLHASLLRLPSHKKARLMSVSAGDTSTGELAQGCRCALVADTGQRARRIQRGSVKTDQTCCGAEWGIAHSSAARAPRWWRGRRVAPRCPATAGGACPGGELRFKRARNLLRC